MGPTNWRVDLGHLRRAALRRGDVRRAWERCSRKPESQGIVTRSDQSMAGHLVLDERIPLG